VKRLAVCCVLAALLAAPAAQAAPNPATLSVQATNAFFKGQWSTMWQLLDPRYRAITTEAKYRACKAKEAKTFPRLLIERVTATTTERGTYAFPLLGKIPVSVVTVQMFFRAPGDTATQTSLNTAYWTRYRGSWYALMVPSSYRAFKAGRCP
jgi:hypothetical protein